MRSVAWWAAVCISSLMSSITLPMNSASFGITIRRATLKLLLDNAATLVIYCRQIQYALSDRNWLLLGTTPCHVSRVQWPKYHSPISYRGFAISYSHRIGAYSSPPLLSEQHKPVRSTWLRTLLLLINKKIALNISKTLVGDILVIKLTHSIKSDP